MAIRKWSLDYFLEKKKKLTWSHFYITQIFKKIIQYSLKGQRKKRYFIKQCISDVVTGVMEIV